MTYNIRRARHSDAEGIINAHIKSIRKICSKDYTSAEIEAWSGRKFRVPHWQDTIDRDFVWVIECNNAVQGFAHFAVMDSENGEVMGLYLTPEVCGKGFARKLFTKIFQVASDQKLKKINLHATKTAKSFYEHLGFLQTSSDTTIEMQGVPIPCFPMEFDI